MTRQIDIASQDQATSTRPGKARQGKAKQGKARQDKARQSKARQSKARQDKARQVTPGLSNRSLTPFIYLLSIICCHLPSVISYFVFQTISASTREVSQSSNKKHSVGPSFLPLLSYYRYKTSQVGGAGRAISFCSCEPSRAPHSL